MNWKYFGPFGKPKAEFFPDITLKTEILRVPFSNEKITHLTASRLQIPSIKRTFTNPAWWWGTPTRSPPFPFPSQATPLVQTRRPIGPFPRLQRPQASPTRIRAPPTSPTQATPRRSSTWSCLTPRRPCREKCQLVRLVSRVETRRSVARSTAWSIATSGVRSASGRKHAAASAIEGGKSTRWLSSKIEPFPFWSKEVVLVNTGTL